MFLTISTIIIFTEKAECKKESESPQYRVVHSESEFEVRFYGESAWMTASVDDISFEKATRNGFHRWYPFSDFFSLSSFQNYFFRHNRCCLLFYCLLIVYGIMTKK